MSDAKLINAIETLIAFLAPTKSDHWTSLLSEVVSEFRLGSNSDRSACKLEELFGGMGSLNDLYFCKTNNNLPNGEDERPFNDNFSKLMNRVFKQLRLRNSGLIPRVQWRYFEWKNRNGLTPRIMKTFRGGVER